MNDNKAHNIEYNSSKELLVMPEYGRHIQGMIRFAQSVEDQEKKKSYINRIVKLMMQMVPQNRNMDDVKTKLWKHVYRIAEGELGVEPPEGVDVTPDEENKKPEHPGYPVVEPRFRHYGHNVQELMRKAISMEEGEMKDAFVEVIGSYMKLAYKTWNKEHYVSDDVIIDDIKSLSNGKLELKEDAVINNLTQANRKKERMREENAKRNKSNRGDGGSRRRYHKRRK